MDTTPHKPGPVPKHYVAMHVCVPPALRDWAKRQPEGVSALVRRLLAAERARRTDDSARVAHTDRHLVEDANALARMLYRHLGYVVADGYRFDTAHHPQEQMCWRMAVLAYEHIACTDIMDALTGLDDDG